MGKRDPVFGRGMSPVATLGKRLTWFVILVALPDGHKADVVAPVLAVKITTLAAALTRTLTWDQSRDGCPRRVHRRHRNPGLLLRPQVARALAARWM